MSHPAVELAALLGGFAFLAKGANGLVDGGVSLARRWGISPLTIGLTVIAWGTSMPEIVVSGVSAYKGKFGQSIGTVLGSNVANIGLVMGASALILPKILHGRVSRREAFWLLTSLGILLALLWDGAFTRLDALLILAAFTLYKIILFRAPREEGLEALEEEATHRSRSPWVAVILGSIAIAVGAQLVMMGGEGLALRAGISPRVIGLSVFAIGTSLPELAAGVGSALKGHSEIGIGNVIGSNVFNTMAVMGVAGLVGPVNDAATLDRVITTDFPVVVGVSVALIVLPVLFEGKGGRGKAALLLAAYFSYMTYLFLGGSKF